jgi:hypothetical protein
MTQKEWSFSQQILPDQRFVERGSMRSPVCQGGGVAFADRTPHA